MWRRPIACALVAGQLALGLSGCVSVREAGTRSVPGPGGGVSVRVFADDAARRAQQPGPPGVVGELERQENGGWAPVFRSLDATWAVAGLPPGRYRLKVPARLDEAGNVVRLDQRPLQLNVSEERVTELEIVLRHVDTGAVVAGAVAVVIAAILLHEWLDSHDLPEPPLPPPEIVDAIVWVSVDLSTGPGWRGASDRLPPVVTSHFPAQGALVAARRPRVVISLSEALAAESLDPAKVSVLSAKGGLISGLVSYDAEHWWVVWEPQTDLPPDDQIHVTLAADAVEDLGGNEMEAPVTFTFRTAP